MLPLQINIHDCTAVSPFALLFFGGDFTVHNVISLTISGFFVGNIDEQLQRLILCRDGYYLLGAMHESSICCGNMSVHPFIHL